MTSKQCELPSLERESQIGPESQNVIICTEKQRCSIVVFGHLCCPSQGNKKVSFLLPPVLGSHLVSPRRPSVSRVPPASSAKEALPLSSVGFDLLYSTNAHWASLLLPDAMLGVGVS